MGFVILMLVMVLAPVGSILFLALLALSFTERYADAARASLRRGCVVGAICAVLAAPFLLDPGLLLPGAGTPAIVLAVFMAGFAGSVGLKFPALR